MNSKEIVLSYWDAMRSNDFYAASECLSEDFECVWPQSSEIIRGREDFAALNTAYPTNGKWEFTLNTIVSGVDVIVTDVSITDGVQHARAITFHSIKDSHICKQVEFWPDDYEAPEWRAQWVSNANSPGN